VTGTLSPDVTGSYYSSGVINGQPSYLQGNVDPGSAYLIYYHTFTDNWYLQREAEDFVSPYWLSNTSGEGGLYATYNPSLVSTATGDATVQPSLAAVSESSEST
jgi:hypothetical protein